MGHNLQINWSNADKIIVKKHHIQCPPEDLNLIVTFVLVNSYDHRDKACNNLHRDSRTNQMISLKDDTPYESHLVISASLISAMKEVYLKRQYSHFMQFPGQQD